MPFINARAKGMNEWMNKTFILLSDMGYFYEWDHVNCDETINSKQHHVWLQCECNVAG